MTAMNQDTDETISSCVEKVVTRYLEDLRGEEVNDLFSMVIAQVEEPLVKVVMNHVDDNQSKAARLLGINRNTLRKKLEVYDFGSP